MRSHISLDIRGFRWLTNIGRILLATTVLAKKWCTNESTILRSQAPVLVQNCEDPAATEGMGVLFLAMKGWFCTTSGLEVRDVKELKRIGCCFQQKIQCHEFTCDGKGRERKHLIRAVYYLLNSIDRQTSWKIKGNLLYLEAGSILTSAGPAWDFGVQLTVHECEYQWVWE